MMLYCNNEGCRFNEEHQCTCASVFYINRLCVTYKRKNKKMNGKELMQAPFSPGCKKESGKFKSNRINILK